MGEWNINLYQDIKERTKGEIYIGVVGPVRTGKSTFIKRFMELFVLPQMTDENGQMRARDELPQSSGGRMITTTEPKFIPQEAVEITLGEDITCKVRMVDCVGFMVSGASGHVEDDAERMVKTPWSDTEIPFTKAAEIGTKKVIEDHSTIGVVVTTDGSFGEIERNDYIPAEERTVQELKKCRKPFVVLLNCERPYSEEAARLAEELSEKYLVTVIPVNCEQLKKDDIYKIMQGALYEFPIARMEFYMPKWVEMLPADHVLKQELLDKVGDLLKGVNVLKDLTGNGQGYRSFPMESDFIKDIKIDNIDMATGTVHVSMELEDAFYYEMLSDVTGEKIENDYQLMEALKSMALMKTEYCKVQSAMEQVRSKGYGVVMPNREEITLEKPELIRHGNKYGVKIKAESPSIHMIKASIETEIAPIVGTEIQAQDLIQYIAKDGESKNDIWDTNIFGKTVEQLVQDGINSKIAMIGDDSQMKLQDSMQKIVNDTNGGMVCIII